MNKPWTEEELDLLYAEYREVGNMTVLADKYGVSHERIRQLVNKRETPDGFRGHIRYDSIRFTLDWEKLKAEVRKDFSKVRAVKKKWAARYGISIPSINHWWAIVWPEYHAEKRAWQAGREDFAFAQYDSGKTVAEVASLLERSWQHAWKMVEAGRRRCRKPRRSGDLTSADIERLRKWWASPRWTVGRIAGRLGVNIPAVRYLRETLNLGPKA